MPPRQQLRRGPGLLRGKPPKLKATQEAHLVKLWHDGDYSALELGELFNVSRAKVYRHPAQRNKHRIFVGPSRPAKSRNRGLD